MKNKPSVLSQPKELPSQYNALGEAPLIDAPKSTLDNGTIAIPQQFFHYSRDKDNVEHVISKIQFSDKYPIFVYELVNQVFLQIGIIGHENYPPNNSPNASKRNDKIVYGRKWYIEPHTPTSEVIQTAFLALQKVREHELREFFTLEFEHKGRVHRSTPFNTHMDLPLMANNVDLFAQHQSIELSKATPEQTKKHITSLLNNTLSQLSIANTKLSLGQVTPISQGMWHVIVTTDKATALLNHFFPEFDQTTLSLTININHRKHTEEGLATQFIHLLVNCLLQKSYDYLSEKFTFDGFARFSQHIHPENIAKFSISTRCFNQSTRSPAFTEAFKAMSTHVDGGKAPEMAQTSSLNNIQSQALANSKDLEGFLPKKQASF